MAGMTPLMARIMRYNAKHGENRLAGAIAAKPVMDAPNLRALEAVKTARKISEEGPRAMTGGKGRAGKKPMERPVARRMMV